MHFLYPSDPLRTKKCDEVYAAEFVAVQEAGFETSVFPFEEFQAGSLRPFPALQKDNTVIYRGWMLSATEYDAFISAVIEAGARPLSDTKTYLLAHHLPNWYPLIEEFTPMTRIFSVDTDLGAELNALGWNEYFIKDYVKSLKTSVGSRISTPEQAAKVVSEMLQFRGKIEGGFCVRQVENFLPQTEQRFFVMDSIPCSMDAEIPAIVSDCARRVDSRFFSVDVVQRNDGKLRIVEIGDGQVSDIVGWTPGNFAKCLAKCFSGKN